MTKVKVSMMKVVGRLAVAAALTLCALSAATTRQAASRAAAKFKLEVEDPLTGPRAVRGAASKEAQGGRFVPQGWTPGAGETRIVIALVKGFGPADAGRVELDVTNFDPERQYKESGQAKSHLLAMYSNADGSQTGEEADENCGWQLRGGANYLNRTGAPGAGFKLLWRPRGAGTRGEKFIINDRTGWDKNKTYTLAVEWDARQIALFVDGEKVFESPAERGYGDRQRELKYIYLGADRYFSRANAIPGPIYKGLRVYRRQ
jgi:hypothetical protein